MRLAGWRSPQMVGRYAASVADGRARDAFRRAALEVLGKETGRVDTSVGGHRDDLLQGDLVGLLKDRAVTVFYVLNDTLPSKASYTTSLDSTTTQGPVVLGRGHGETIRVGEDVTSWRTRTRERSTQVAIPLDIVDDNSVVIDDCRRGTAEIPGSWLREAMTAKRRRVVYTIQ